MADKEMEEEEWVRRESHVAIVVKTINVYRSSIYVHSSTQLKDALSAKTIYSYVYNREPYGRPRKLILNIAILKYNAMRTSSRLIVFASYAIR